jgi:pyruvate dehydrogenase E1 component alpha subunit
MPLTTLDSFEIKRLEILDPDGKADAALDPGLDRETLLRMYSVMTLARVFDERAFKLQRQGRLGTYPQILGQEATQCIPPFLLEKKDWLVPTYRGQGAYFARGMDPKNSLLIWGGDDRGVDFKKGQNDMIFSITVGGHLTQAAGLAWASKFLKKGQVVLAYLGDGATSRGDFAEGMNFAGLWKLPLVYFIENNQWAISLPRETQSASKTLAQKAFGYGLEALQLDGNDPLAVFVGVKDAVERARKGLGATVVEGVTYRMGHHTTADDATRYRSDKELEEWRRKDPLVRFKKYLLAREVLDEAEEARILKEAEERVQKAIAEYDATPEPDPMAIFENVFAEPTWVIREERREFEEILKNRRTMLEMAAPMPEGRFP